MSYCVNCGVELAPSEPRCPLCDTEVINPADPWKEPEHRPYPTYLEAVVKRVDKKYFCMLAAVLMLIPVVVCLLVDILTAGEITWSGYVVGAILMMMVICLVPLAYGKRRWLLFLLLDIAAVLGYLLYIDAANEGIGWFLPLAMPITLASGAIVGLFIHYLRHRKKKGILAVFSLFFIGCGTLTVLIELFVRVYRGLSFVPRWSWYAFAPCLLTGVAFLILNRRNKWKDSVKKRLFF